MIVQKYSIQELYSRYISKLYRKGTRSVECKIGEALWIGTLSEERSSRSLQPLNQSARSMIFSAPVENGFNKLKKIIRKHLLWKCMLCSALHPHNFELDYAEEGEPLKRRLNRNCYNQHSMRQNSRSKAEGSKTISTCRWVRARRIRSVKSRRGS